MCTYIYIYISSAARFLVRSSLAHRAPPTLSPPPSLCHDPLLRNLSPTSPSTSGPHPKYRHPQRVCMYIYDIYLRGPPLLHPSRQVKSSSVRFYTGYFLLIRVEGCEPVFEKCVGEFLFFFFFLRMQVLLLLERSTKWGKSNLEEIRL